VQYPFCQFVKTRSVGQDGSVGVATRYGLHGPGFWSRCDRNIPHESRPGLGPTQPYVQCVQGFFPEGKLAGPWRLPPIAVLILRLNRNTAVPLLPLCAFMVRSRVNFLELRDSTEQHSGNTDKCCRFVSRVFHVSMCKMFVADMLIFLIAVFHLKLVLSQSTPYVLLISTLIRHLP
jgi:hypothetical protein